MENQNPLDLDRHTVRHKYTDPEEFCKAIVEYQVSEIESGTQVRISPEQKDSLYNIIRESINDEIWENTE